uniref:Uncharacterized protein n=1 Tax=Desertifilum tharense IPPAS B-1220 TaxID=1781255 RepID=A0ACD5GXT3_9CYAN
MSSQPERERTYEIAANITFLEQVAIGADFAPIFYVSPRTRKPVPLLWLPRFAMQMAIASACWSLNSI